MNRKTKRIAIAGLSAALLTAAVGGSALAKSASVTAQLDYTDITITMDGVAIDPKDVNGESTEPFAMDGTTYLPVRALCEAMGWTVEWEEGGSTVKITTTTEETPGAPEQETLVATVNCVYDAESPVTITDEAFDQYFETTALEGVESILANGRFYVNGAPLPATEGEFFLNGAIGEGGLWYNEEGGGWTYMAHVYFNNMPDQFPEFGTEANVDFETARLRFAEGLSQFQGSSLNLYDTDGDGYTDKITTYYYDSALIADVVIEGDTAKLYGVDEAREAPAEGEIAFTSNYPAEFPASVVQEQGITAGDYVLFWYDEAQGAWQIQKAVARVGTLIENPDDDHHPYWVDLGGSEEIPDNDSLSNKSYLPEFTRHTQFIRGFRRTGGYECGEPVIMWTAPGNYYAFGFTRGESAYDYLETAILSCQSGISDANVVVSEAGDGSDVPSSQNWVTREVMTAYENQLEAAKTMLAEKTASNLEVDAQIFALGNVYGGTEGGMNPAGLIGSMQPGTAQ